MRKKTEQRFVVEVVIDGMVRYMYTRRVSLACVELAQRFQHRKSAERFYRTSSFFVCDAPMRILSVSAKTLALLPEEKS